VVITYRYRFKGKILDVAKVYLYIEFKGLRQEKQMPKLKQDAGER